MTGWPVGGWLMMMVSTACASQQGSFSRNLLQKGGWAYIHDGSFNPSEKYQSVRMIIPNIWKTKKCSQTTNQWCFMMCSMALHMLQPCLQALSPPVCGILAFRFSRISRVSRFVMGLQVDIRLAQLVRHTLPWSGWTATEIPVTCRKTEKDRERTKVLNIARDLESMNLAPITVSCSAFSPLESSTTFKLDPGSNSSRSPGSSSPDTIHEVIIFINAASLGYL